MRYLRAFSLLLTVCLLLTTAVSADLIFLPPDNFYLSHSSDCRVENCDYVTNGAEGYVTLWFTPEMQDKYVNAANGLTFYCPWIYTAPDGTEWCAVESDDPSDPYAWIPLSDCALLKEDGTVEDGVELIPTAEHIPYVFRPSDLTIVLIIALAVGTWLLIRKLFASRKTP